MRPYVITTDSSADLEENFLKVDIKFREVFMELVHR